jgi:hypothetical protein
MAWPSCPPPEEVLCCDVTIPLGNIVISSPTRSFPALKEVLRDDITPLSPYKTPTLAKGMALTVFLLCNVVVRVTERSTNSISSKIPAGGL